MVQQQSPEAHYQQNQLTCGGLPEEQEAACPGCHPGRGSEEGGLIQVPWVPDQLKTVVISKLILELWPKTCFVRLW